MLKKTKIKLNGAQRVNVIFLFLIAFKYQQTRDNIARARGSAKEKRIRRPWEAVKGEISYGIFL